MNYGKDGDFNDPVVRCDSCQKLLRMERLRDRGKCTCGARKVRNVQSFTAEERGKMDGWGIDPAFIALFQESSDD